MELPKIRVTYDGFMPVYWKDRHTHLTLLGKSGQGKSSFIKHCWYQDNMYRNAKILIEPSGFLAHECYSISGGEYCSLKTPISINPMQSNYDPDTISDLIAECINQVISICSSNQPFTVKMRSLLDESIKWCLERNRRSLIHVKTHLEAQTGNTETRDGIIHRLNFLLNDERFHTIITGNDSIKWGELIANKGTFILDGFGLSKEKMIFAGNLISQGIKNYFRYERPKEYKPVSIYVDECHNFINTNFMDILKEGRKFKLSCLLATQDFSDIEDKLTRAMLNVGNIVSYRLGSREARMVASELGVTAPDVQLLEKHSLAYLLGNKSGTGKAPRPPQVKIVTIKKVEPKKTSRGWFTLEPYPV
ncbi:MAG: hypothetical protein AB9873_13025 [Syntrophobacteraceae bacterium]